MIDAKVLLSCIDSQFESRLRKALREIQSKGGIFKELILSHSQNDDERVQKVIILYEDNGNHTEINEPVSYNYKLVDE